MKQQLIKIATPVICLVGILASLHHDYRPEQMLEVYISLAPLIILALLGCRATKSRTLPVILLVTATLVTGWSYEITSAVMEGGNGQKGMGILVVCIIQWIIVVFATICSVLLRKGYEDPAKTARVLAGHESNVWEVAISPDNHWLVTGSEDNTARLWDLTAEDWGGQFQNAPYGPRGVQTR